MLVAWIFYEIEHHLEFLSLKGGCKALLSLHLSKCYIDGNHMSGLNYIILVIVIIIIIILVIIIIIIIIIFIIINVIIIISIIIFIIIIIIIIIICRAITNE